ncbi:hypothetical protein E2562_004631 [Oryza meyeriana var. granulata]|uniref:Large ribosomal subunit protein mL43 n=1 Tax=Oryza meyeriana var. granulata TaxID=110450 RepID=A0A6G1F3R5_9ORYZ|nr:hypothetical protein E2562_004631 [Oryza meyeriana var. granulata]
MQQLRGSKIYLQYYINEKGDKVYTTKKESPLGVLTQSAHPGFLPSPVPAPQPLATTLSPLARPSSLPPSVAARFPDARPPTARTPTSPCLLVFLIHSVTRRTVLLSEAEVPVQLPIWIDPGCGGMALRGVWQLQKLVVNYCDWGGSSRGIRAFMEAQLPAFKEKNPHLEVVTELVRGQHPNLKGIYSKIFSLDFQSL